MPNPPWTRLIRSRLGNPLASTPCRVWAPSAHRSDSVTPSAALRVEAEPVVEVRGDLEARGVDEQVDRVLDAVDHRAPGRDLVDAPSVGVHQVHVGPVERRQVVVVEADPLAVLAPVRLELLGRLGVLDDLVDPPPDRLHGLEVDPLELLGLLRDSRTSGCRPTAARSSRRPPGSTSGWAPVTAWVKLTIRSCCQPGSRLWNHSTSVGCWLRTPTAPGVRWKT